MFFNLYKAGFPLCRVVLFPAAVIMFYTLRKVILAVRSKELSSKLVKEEKTCFTNLKRFFFKELRPLEIFFLSDNIRQLIFHQNKKNEGARPKKMFIKFWTP